MAQRALVGLRRHRGGAVAMEFVMLIPVMAIIMFAAFDIGGILYARFRLSTAVAAGAALVTVRADEAAGSNAGELATSAANLVANANGNGWAAARVVINNGPIAEKTGTAAASLANDNNVDDGPNSQCYCPTGDNSWGSSTSCGGVCANGGIAGRWVRISARRRFQPIFSAYGMVPGDGFITAVTLVQIE